LAYQTLITAAGDSRRDFVATGFGSPKSLMRVNDSYLITEAIKSYSHGNGPVIVAVNHEENLEYFVSKAITDKFPEATIVQVGSAVQGALATAAIAAEHLDPCAPLVIAAGDSLLAGGLERHISELQSMDSDAGTVVFDSPNVRWSHINIAQGGQVLEVTEKSTPGRFATTGCFYFKSASIFLDAASWVFVNNARVQGAFFVSTSLNYLIAKGMSVKYVVVPRSDYESYSKPADFLTQPD
jgi:hypothetical protein